ncbi:glycosyltransferase family 2 protein [Campylobacter lari]|nr:glycosyltransferase family 2 protein [Campylobacter lari]MBT0818930.1 glycosyltransferase family 2 protein [Campylobacter lari]MBT0833100.1 glycosyltransferase family 2 protein [Campylobacter lari]
MQKITSTNKTIGIVIPIYNVEKYLKECLDSVINQTYTNLEIILVNDGSTDENSLNIAKEYTLKDKRITLFDKKNGGQSTARNVGIEYFSGEYKLKNKTQTIKENSLIEFNIEGNNPYEIYTVYKSYKAFNDEQDLTSFTYPIIDYIIFLDSDDYWELNCIEECVPRMDGVDVVWFDVKTVLDGVSHSDWKSNIKWLNFSQECILDRDDWLKIMYEHKMRWFYFAWQGVINFNFLKNIKLKFINYIVQEDDYFGILLFSQMKYCYILPKELYFYRIRPNSTMAYQAKITAKNIPMFFKENLDYFDNDAILTREYFHVSSHVITCINMINFFDKKNDDILTKSLLKYLLPTYIKNAYEIIHFSKDPLGLLSNVEAIKNLMDKYGIKPHGVEFRFKNELPYAIGSIILQNCKSFKKICKLPRQIYKILKQNKINQKLFKARIVEHPYTILPHLYEYEDVAKIDRLKEHLSFKIGLAFLKGHKYRYFGGYLVFLFNSLKLFLSRYRNTNIKQTKQSKDVSSTEKLEQRLSYMHWELTRSREILEQRLVNINYELHQLRLLEEKKNDIFKEESILNISNVMNLLKIPDVIRHDFVNIFHKKSLFIDTTKDYLDTYNYLNKFDNIDVYAFEPNEVRFALIQKEKLKKLKIFNFVLGKEEVVKRFLPIGGSLQKEYMLMPNFYNVPKSSLVNVVDIVQFLENVKNSEYDFLILKLELNLQNINIVEKIIQNDLYLDFSYIIMQTCNDYMRDLFLDKVKKSMCNANNVYII